MRLPVEQSGYSGCIGTCGDAIMEKNGDEIAVTEIEASGGVKNHNVRIVLGVSMLLVIVLLSAIWITGAALT
jgi:hypothetical protein